MGGQLAHLARRFLSRLYMGEFDPGCLDDSHRNLARKQLSSCCTCPFPKKFISVSGPAQLERLYIGKLSPTSLDLATSQVRICLSGRLASLINSPFVNLRKPTSKRPLIRTIVKYDCTLQCIRSSHWSHPDLLVLQRANPKQYLCFYTTLQTPWANNDTPQQYRVYGP